MQPEQNTGFSASTDTPQVTLVGSINDGSDKKNLQKNTNLIIIIIVLAVLAVGGIGFGVMTMITKNQEISNLQGQISNLNNQLEDTVGTVDDPEEVERFITLDDWDVKVNVPNDYEQIDFETKDVTEGEFAGVPGASVLTLSTGDNGATDPCGNASVIRVPKGTVTDKKPAFTKGDYDYFKDPNATCTDEENSERPAAVLEAILTDPNNYSIL